MTIEAASAPETKKIATSSMTTTEVMVDSGMWWSIAKSDPSAVACAGQVGALALHVDAGAAEDGEPHQADTTLGTRSTPVTNWRMVRPREMRAMNMPTKGVHDTHQAQ